MAIYYMHGETFKKIFMKEKPTDILKTTYILVSTRIRTTGKYKDNVVNLANALLPNERVMSDFTHITDEDYFKEIYFKQLKEHKILLARIVKEAVQNNTTVVFLCSENEKKSKYLKYISEYIENEFDFPVYNYKKIKTGKEKARPFGKNHVLLKCEKTIEKSLKKKQKELMNTKSGRKKLLDKMSKEDMINELKKLNLYIKGMEKDEMYDMLELYFVG